MNAVAALVSLAATVLAARPTITWLEARSVIDVPGARSSHARPTLRGGGLAPTAGAGLGAILLALHDPRVALGVAATAMAFGLLGFTEDVRGVPTLVRLAVQASVAAAATVPLLFLADEPPMLALIGLGVLWLVAYVNAFNFMDGINGISAAQSIVAGGAWGVIGWWKDEPVLAGLGLVIAAAALGFLPFNFPHARVFLGDVGSYFLGAWLAATAVVGLQAGIPPEAVLAPLALYVADTGLTLVRRAVRGEPILEPHRSHVYQRLVQAGWTHTRTTLVVGTMMSASAGLGALSTVDGLRVVADASLVAVLVFYLALPRVVRLSGASQPPVARSLPT